MACQLKNVILHYDAYFKLKKSTQGIYRSSSWTVAPYDTQGIYRSSSWTVAPYDTQGIYRSSSWTVAPYDIWHHFLLIFGNALCLMQYRMDFLSYSYYSIEMIIYVTYIKKRIWEIYNPRSLVADKKSITGIFEIFENLW